MIYFNNYQSMQGYIIIGAMLCYLFITQTLGPQLWHIPFCSYGAILSFHGILYLYLQLSI